MIFMIHPIPNSFPLPFVDLVIESWYQVPFSFLILVIHRMLFWVWLLALFVSKIILFLMKVSKFHAFRNTDLRAQQHPFSLLISNLFFSKHKILVVFIFSIDLIDSFLYCLFFDSVYFRLSFLLLDMNLEDWF